MFGILSRRQAEEGGAENLQPGNASDYSATGLRAYLTVLTVLPVLAVALRFWSRCIGERGRPPFWWDDWMALASLIPIAAMSGHIYAMFDYGLGRHAWTLVEDELITFLKLLFSANFMFDLGVFSTKACALLFFSRVFPAHASSRGFNWSVWITHGLNLGWLIGIVIVTFFLCTPIEAVWNPRVKGDCRHQVPVYIGSAISSVVIDIIILLLPLPKIWRLQMSVGKKGALMLVFLLGYLVIVVSIGRMVTMLKRAEAMSVDPSYQIADMNFWILAESPTILTGACLPALLPLARRGYRKFSNTINSYMANNSRTTQGGGASKSGFATFGDEDAPAIAMHPYSAVDELSSKGRQTEDLESFGSSESTHRIVPQGTWHRSRVERGSRSEAETAETPNNRIRVARGFTVN